MTSNFIRLAALELIATSPSQVVKVAGVLRRMKNWLKSLVDSGYASEADQLKLNSLQLQELSKKLNTAIEELLSSIKDNDLGTYKLRLEEVTELSQELSAYLSKTPELAKENLKEFKRSYTKEDKPEEVLSSSGVIKTWFPEHDVDFSSHLNRKLTDFQWFQRYLPNKIYIADGAKRGAKDNAISAVLHMLKRHSSVEQQVVETEFNKPEIIQELFTRLRTAILTGTVISYLPASVSKDFKERKVGQIQVIVQSMPFELPVGHIKATCLAILQDQISPGTEPKLILQGTREWRPAETLGVALVPNKTEAYDTVSSLRKLAGINFSASKNLSPEFWQQFVAMAGRIGANPVDLAKVIYSESGFDPGATNVQGGRVIAKGLNQIIKKTGQVLGLSDSDWESFERRSAEEQLPVVEKFFKLFGVKQWNSAVQLYVANFAPKYIRQATPETVLYNAKDHPLAYKQNQGLDRDKKGSITVADLSKSISGKLPEHIVAAINQASSGSLSSTPNSSPDSETSSEPDELISTLLAHSVENITKQAILSQILPTSQVLISFSSLLPESDQYQFATGLSKVLSQVIQAETTLHKNGKKLELSCQVVGSQYKVASAVKALADCAAVAFPRSIMYQVLPGISSQFAKIGV